MTGGFAIAAIPCHKRGVPVEFSATKSSGAAIADSLLAWYDRHARALPWRSPPGAVPPDPYRVWLAEVMLQQTTVAAVIPYYERFTVRWPTVAALVQADDAALMAAWAGLGYYARARNLLACARAVVARGGWPETEAELRALPGIGAYTAAAVAAIAFDRRAVVVDGNVERVVARLFAVEAPLPAARPQLRALTDQITPDERPGDFAQGMMDLGATICTPRAPACLACPLAASCQALATGAPALYPRRSPKVAKPERSATAWWIERDGYVLLVRRPASGLLGGMRALPSTLGPSSWAPDGEDAPLGQVVHVFTHFRLTLAVVAASVEPGCVLPPSAEWWRIEALGQAGLPTLYANAAAAAMRERP